MLDRHPFVRFLAPILCAFRVPLAQLHEQLQKLFLEELWQRGEKIWKKELQVRSRRISRLSTAKSVKRSGKRQLPLGSATHLPPSLENCLYTSW
jgi:hypothetical protein